ncbi:MAG: radical SAM protein [Verrucomicrobia bacterium]|nr:radical SAM protein [Verrucomicrobiota bacterium]
MSKLKEFLLNARYAFNPRKPFLFGRLVGAVARTYVFGRPPLRYVDFSLDFACNLRCQHCFATALQQPGRRRMTVADYARVARECMSLGAVNFSFQGGEPLLFRELGDIITACQPPRNVISVTTNGTLLTPERIANLKRFGVDILTISLDSAIAEEHDRFRGVSGSFEKTMAGIRLALKEGLRVTLGTVVTRQTVRSEGITALIRLAQDLKVLLYFILPVPAGRWSSHRQMLLTPEDLTYLDEWTRRSRYLRTDFQANFGGHGCGAVKEILYLTPYGDVLPCPFLHITFGNVLEEPVNVIRDRALQNPYFAVYHQKCLASTDEEFIEEYLSKTFGADKLPLRWDCVFPPQEGEKAK